MLQSIVQRLLAGIGLALLLASAAHADPQCQIQRTQQKTECVKRANTCAQYQQQCVRKQTVCAAHNSKGQCIRTREVCAQYQQVCVQHKQECVQQRNVCIKREKVCQPQGGNAFRQLQSIESGRGNFDGR